MTTTSPPSSQPPSRHPARAALTSAWLRAVSPTGNTSLARAEFEGVLAGLVDLLAEALASEPFAPMGAAPVGASIVGLNFTDAQSLRASVQALSAGLADVAGEAGAADPAGRVGAVLGGFAAGYAAALRDWLFAQQEQVKQALQRATGEAERQLRHSEALFREVFVRSAVGIAISDADGRLAQVNPALADILDVPAAELVGRGLEEFFHPDEDVDLRSELDELAELGGRPLRRRRRLVRPDGMIMWAYLAVSVLGEADDAPARHLTMIENVSDLHLLQDLTSHQALHDVLTGLPNRQYLLSQLQSRLSRQPGPGHLTLYQLDIDGFSAVNGGLGPEQGDQVLINVGRKLEELFAGQDALVARLGADEFAVLVSAGSDPPDVLRTVSRINDQLAEPVHLPGGGVGVSASIGVAHGSVGLIGPTELLRAADVTLRRARAVGARQWAEYDQHRDVIDRRTLSLAATLSGAFEFGDVQQCWQPWRMLADDTLAGVSVRVRWDHPRFGLVEHFHCLEVAERTGAALVLGAWLIDTACRQARAWQDRLGDRAPMIGLGLTATQTADPDLVGTVRAAVRRAGIEPGALSIGVPARALVRTDGEARENVGLLAGMGIGVVLSEVGAAPADLTMLDEVTVQAVQIAEPLVGDLATRPADSIAARATASLVGTLHRAGLPVLVSGVRDIAQVNWWQSIGAQAACGEFFGQPRTVEEITAILADAPVRGEHARGC